MNREDLQRNWGVIEAFKNGADVEVSENGCNKWCVTTDPMFDFYGFDYRIKPKQQYIPFDFTDADDIIGRVVRNKQHKCLSIITNVFEMSVSVGGARVSYSDFLNDYEFSDGEPCGKLKI